MMATVYDAGPALKQHCQIDVAGEMIRQREPLPVR